MTNNETNSGTKWVERYEITFIDSFYCEPHTAIFGDTKSAVIRDNAIAWMESVGFRGVAFNVIEVGEFWAGDLDREWQDGPRPWHTGGAR